MTEHAHLFPQGFSIFDVHAHLGIFGEQHNFPPFYLDALCDKFPIERFIWAPFSWDESYRFLKSTEVTVFSGQTHNKAMRWLWISPTREAALSLLNQNVCPSGYAGIKLHPYADNYDLTATLMNPIIEAAERWQVPVAIHTGNRGCSAGLVSRCFPKTFTCPVFLFHSRPFEEAVAVARQLPSACLELSFDSSKTLARAYDEVGPDRIIFGSDYPTAALFYKGLDVLELYRQNLLELLDVTERCGITKGFFYDNAAKLFSINAPPASQ